MESLNTTLLPKILGSLMQKPKLTDTFENLCNELQEYASRYDFKAAVEIGHNLGVLTETNGVVRMPFTLNDIKEIPGNANEAGNSDDGAEPVRKSVRRQNAEIVRKSERRQNAETVRKSVRRRTPSSKRRETQESTASRTPRVQLRRVGRSNAATSDVESANRSARRQSTQPRRRRTRRSASGSTRRSQRSRSGRGRARSQGRSQSQGRRAQTPSRGTRRRR